jgi:hypothetical protein
MLDEIELVEDAVLKPVVESASELSPTSSSYCSVSVHFALGQSG